METVEIIFTILILIISVVIHEVAHGYAALLMGDSTAKYAGRLTLNPVKHIDFFGSIILPLITAILPGNLVLGYAKPVPYNPYNLKNQRWGEFVIAIAGPISNFILAIFFGILIRNAGFFNLSESFLALSSVVVTMNVVLAVFNLIPIPPLDGSKILFSLLPAKFMYIRRMIENSSLILILIFVMFLWQILDPIIYWLIKLITGI